MNVKLNLPLLAGAFFASLLVFGTVNYFYGLFENTLAFKELGLEPAQATLLATQVRDIEQFKPLRNWQLSSFESKANSALALLIKPNSNQSYILYSKDAQAPRPIASISKLLTALLALKNGNLNEHVTIAELLPEDNGQLTLDAKFSSWDLLRLALIASNNTAANALAERNGDDFVIQLNNLAANLGMDQSTFVNATGLDPDQLGQKSNIASALNVAKLAMAVLTEPQLVEILATTNTTVYGQDGLDYPLKDTDELLGEAWVIFGKTGWTPLAQGCLVLVSAAPSSGDYLVSVVLGSQDRFQDMRELNKWVRAAYIY